MFLKLSILLVVGKIVDASELCGNKGYQSCDVFINLTSYKYLTKVVSACYRNCQLCYMVVKHGLLH